MTEKAEALLRRLKREMNGAVVGAMEGRGIVYPVSYGVSIPAIREVAAGYAPDHGLALELYRSGIRELMLAAVFIDDPSAVTAGQMHEWAAGFTNHEIAGNTATHLFSKAATAIGVALEWIWVDDKILCYAGLLMAAGALRGNRLNPLLQGPPDAGLRDAGLRDAGSRDAGSRDADPPGADFPVVGRTSPPDAGLLAGGQVYSVSTGQEACGRSYSQTPHVNARRQIPDEEILDNLVNSAARVTCRNDFDVALSHGVVTLLERCARLSAPACRKAKELAVGFGDSGNGIVRHTASELSWRLEEL